MYKSLIFVFVLFVSSTILGNEFVLSGHQKSKIHYALEQSIEPFPGIEELQVSFVVPQDFASATYIQKIEELDFEFSIPPDDRKVKEDNRGNLIHEYSWKNPDGIIKGRITLNANNQVILNNLENLTSFPIQNIPEDIALYLKSTELVNSNDPVIMKKAAELTKSTKFEMQAVQNILHFIVDHLRYVQIPEKFDAMYALKTGKGNCQNYSHLAAALLRASGIPARIVNGVTLKKGFEVDTGTSAYSFEMSQGRHSWIEVYFPDLGWLPFDAQQTQFFVSNRYLRIEVGLDNNETIQDGLVRWTQAKGAAKKLPRLEEAIESNFISDDVSIETVKKFSKPHKLLLSPFLAFYKLETEPKIIDEELERYSPKRDKIEKPDINTHKETAIDYTILKYEIPFESGNIDFPRRFDFVSSGFTDRIVEKGQNKLKRNFIVETAEYVTGQRCFAQTFILTEPIQLKKISLALHNFGGSGELWLEISDDENGFPGTPAALSNKVTSNRIRIPRGYDWIDFDFSDQKLILSPGQYWFVLRFSGSPIVNCFYSYGKPVGPSNGTRSRMNNSKTWNMIHSFEFNYRVIGLGVKRVK